ncbi:MAG: ribosome maturation factor RimP [Nitrospinota bacterium]
MENALNIIKKLAAPFLDREGLTLYDLEISAGKKPLIRLYINREGGINHGDCANVSRHLSTLMDVENVFPASYVLEVSSPGLTRKLNKPEHFQKSAGSFAKLIFKKEYDGPKEVRGVIESVGETAESGSFRIVRKDDGQIFEFNFGDVARARLELEK